MVHAMMKRSFFLPIVLSSFGLDGHNHLLSSAYVIHNGVDNLSVTSRRKRVVKTEPVPGLVNGMEYVQLGDSDLVVSKASIGTMMMTSQTTPADSLEQLATAWGDYGVNFLDTSELYPVPTLPDTQGDTDRMIAKFLKSQGRDNVIVSTKVSGRSDKINWLPRNEPDTLACLSKDQIVASVDASLKRLGTDHIDLFLLHWPDRHVPIFGKPDFCPKEYEKAPVPVPFTEQLEALQKVVQQGKVRYVGVSNETPYGVCSMASLAEHFPDLYPKICVTQNAYSLVCRKDFEAGLSEACYHHRLGLVAYSPLAGGALTGKYRTEIPPGTRFSHYVAFMERYLNKIRKPIDGYCKIAEELGITPTQLALSWCYHNELVSSTLFGATSMDQMHENLKALDIRLEPDTIREIQAVYAKYTDPTKEY